MTDAERRFVSLFTNVAQGKATKSIEYWADYFSPGGMNMAHDSAPLTISFDVDVRALKAQAETAA